MFFENLFPSVQKNASILGLTNELKAIYVWNLFLKEQRSLFVVCNSLYQANQFYDTLSLYTSDVLFFPMDDFLTSEALAISPELKTTRIETLTSLMARKPVIVVCNLMGYLRYLPTLEQFEKSSLALKKGQDFVMRDLIESLAALGYTRETVVNKTGEMAIRGFVVDLFPLGEEVPIRLEYWGDTIDSIRSFDMETQRTTTEKSEVIILPNTEFLVEREVPWEEQKQKNLPLYQSKVTNIAGYSSSALCIFDDWSGIEIGTRLLEEEMFEYSIAQGLPGDHSYMFSLADLSWQRKDAVYFMSFDNRLSLDVPEVCYSSFELPSMQGNIESFHQSLVRPLKDNKKTIVSLMNRYQVNKILDQFEDPRFVFTKEDQLFPDHVNLILRPMNAGFELPDCVVFTEKELFHKKEQANTYKTRFRIGSKIRDITKLEVGDYIVHSVHGIGRYCGIKTLTKNGLKKDYLQIEYKDHDKLYIPVEKIELITKYAAKDGMVPKINKLGSSEWEKTKRNAQKKVEDIASELLELYAEREASQGFSFDPDNEMQESFEKDFPYRETADQLKVMGEIKKDMQSPHPMDRLLCGDVGYGKTEIAFRAMMKAVLSGKQVALLCPTTILSNQHYQNALDRFQNYPVKIGLLNRFVSPKVVKETLKGLAEGTIDIVIGTHRVLSEDVRLKNLGLLVIDEEQRFGVKHKEKVKKYRSNIDVLTLSATPIPRTLQMSMAGIRSLSLIETPPINRYPIQTYVLAENKQIVKDAIYKELSRNGQVFLLYNHVDDMTSKQAEIQKLVPEARIICAHGQMAKEELEKIMMQFIAHEYDVLICTTIIETGIDIPSANTLFIMDADHFGLSQLYQIRGRVGRSNKIAYCYLMYTPGKSLSDVAVKRLKVIKEFTELGSGFAIAMRDLSIRGAGDILGSEQAGFIDSIGIELFMTMLQEEIARRQGTETKKEDSLEAPPLLDVATAIADNYVTDEELKIYIHKRINEICSKETLEKVKLEMEDRFGKLSEDMLIYMHEEWFEASARKLGVVQVKQTKNFVELVLDEKTTSLVDGQLLFLELSRISRMFRFRMLGHRLCIILDIVKLERHFVYYLIDLLDILRQALEKSTKKEAE